MHIRFKVSLQGGLLFETKEIPFYEPSFAAKVFELLQYKFSPEQGYEVKVIKSDLDTVNQELQLAAEEQKLKEDVDRMNWVLKARRIKRDMDLYGFSGF